MPIRMLRDWTMSYKMKTLNAQAERFFVRLIMKVDDHGCFYADTSILKANLFPLLLDVIREADLLRWMAECQKAELIVLYESEGKKYLQIQDFRQRLDKARSKFPMPTDTISMSSDSSISVNETPAETEQETETEKRKRKGRAKALVVPPETTTGELKKKYDLLTNSLAGKNTKDVWIGLKDFILSNKPNFIEPYVEIWNVFSGTKNLPRVSVITDARRKKFSTRIVEGEFDFLKVLEQIKLSSHLKGDNDRRWTVTFDWIIESETHYVKILEGQYN